MTSALTRRSFVMAASSATAIAGAGLPMLAASAGPFSASTRPVALLDPRLGRHLPTNWQHESIVLVDPVRQWRDGLFAKVAASGAIALVRWDIALMLRQLGREARLAVTVRPSAPGIFSVNIATRTRPL